jgi:glutamate synthase (NADPH/NADH) large chain
MAKQGVTLPPRRRLRRRHGLPAQGIGFRLACQEEIERAVRYRRPGLLGWRDVPVDNTMPMSPTVRDIEPVIRQVFIGRGPDIMVTDALERKLYVIRRRGQRHPGARPQAQQGVLPAVDVGAHDRLQGHAAGRSGRRVLPTCKDPRCVSALALVHQRFSTNTFPTWHLAHPFRMIAHNGEINTLRGNYNWMRAREKGTSSPLLGADLEKIWPLIYPASPIRPPSTTRSNCW